MADPSEDDAFRALSDGTRRVILEELAARGEQTLYGLCVVLVTQHGIDMSRQGVTKHVEVLEAAGFVTSRQDGRVKLIAFTGHDPLRRVRAWLDRIDDRR